MKSGAVRERKEKKKTTQGKVGESSLELMHSKAEEIIETNHKNK